MLGLFLSLFGPGIAIVVWALLRDDGEKASLLVNAVLCGTLVLAVWTFWQALKALCTTFVPGGIRAPTLVGWRVTAWAEVHRAYWRHGNLYLEARARRVVLNPQLFRDPAAFHRFLAEHLPPTVTGASSPRAA